MPPPPDKQESEGPREMEVTESGTKNLPYSPAQHTRALEFTKGLEAKIQLVMRSSFAWPVSCVQISLSDLAVD